MKYILTIVLFLSFFGAKASPKIHIYSEKKSYGFEIYADNNDVCPITVEFNFNLRNLNSPDGSRRVMVIPAGTKGNHITTLRVKNRTSDSGYDLNCRTSYGDQYDTHYDEDYAYYLPFERNKTFLVSQGYNGRFSHRGINALDFDLPMGSGVYAARDGVVVEVVQDNNRGCLRPDCVEYDNFIIVYHEDGTFADYSHLKQNGARVMEGDVVRQGQLIGYSGNTGFSSDPHLHFEVFLQKIDKRESVRTKFLIRRGEESAYLQENVQYQRLY